MEAEAVLHLIMKKLKEYKANPMRSSAQGKVRQKNLKRMFNIYTTLKRKEKVQQKHKEIIERIKGNSLLQEKSQEFNDIIKNKDDIQITNENNYDQCQLELDDSLINNRIDESLNNYETMKNDVEIPPLENTMYSEESEHSQQYIIHNNIYEGFQNEMILPDGLEAPTTISKANQWIDNQNETKTENYVKESNCESIDGFLLQLGEGLKKLPYRQRSKLEIEFLARLYEVEECLGLLDD